MKNILSFFLSFFLIINFLTVDFAMAQNTNWPGNSSTDNVGIGTTNPFARFHVYDGNNTTTGSSVLFEGEIGGTPTSGRGTRLMWIPEKAAFRVGKVSNIFYYQGQNFDIQEGDDYWDNSNVGYYSFASGYNCRATGVASHAMGAMNKSDAEAAFTFGVSNLATDGSMALGNGNSATGDEGSFVFGRENGATGENSFAFGINSNVLGNHSYAFGRHIYLTGAGSYAFGNQLSSSANDVVLLGHRNAGINNSNTAFEFGIGSGTTNKNVLTMYKDGAVQFNELPGTGNALAIDNDGFVTRTTASGGGGTSFWQANGSTNEIYYSDDVTIGNTSQNRPSNTNLWVNGSAHFR
jgi:hypothetical protein